VSGALPPGPIESFENKTHSALAGVRVRPVTPFTVLLDVEYGRADRPFTPIGEKRYHGETVRGEWRQGAWLVSGRFQAYRNRNNLPPVLTAFEPLPGASHRLESRQYSLGLSWTPKQRWAFDGGYAKLHLDTASGIVNFPLGPSVEERRSLYTSNLHTVHATLRAEAPRGVTVFLGYTLVKDTAEGRGARGQAPSYAAFGFDGTDFVNAYPLSYQSPQARVSVRLHRRASWNAGWQYYRYSERFTGLQNYFAHVGWTSVRWAF